MTLQITSNPEKADVFIREGKILKKLGETPLRVTADELGDRAPYNLVIQKPGFQSEQLLIERRTLSARAEVYASLDKLNSEEQRGVASFGLNSPNHERAIASIQAQLFRKDYRQAELLARDYVKDNPFSPVGWNLLGNAYLMQNRNSDALGAYQKAYEYDSSNQDTARMIEFLSETPRQRGR
jgi:tetratricopeptide (TPR) repeat protein